LEQLEFAENAALAAVSLVGIAVSFFSAGIAAGATALIIATIKAGFSMKRNLVTGKMNRAQTDLTKHSSDLKTALEIITKEEANLKTKESELGVIKKKFN